MLIVKKQLRNLLRVYRIAIEDYAENLWIVYLTRINSKLEKIKSYCEEMNKK